MSTLILIGFGFAALLFAVWLVALGIMAVITPNLDAYRQTVRRR